MRQRQRERELAYFQLLVYRPNGCNIRDWVKLKPGARNFVQVCYVNGRGLKYLCHLLLLPRAIKQGAGSEVE